MNWSRGEFLKNQDHLGHEDANKIKRAPKFDEKILSNWLL